jgi:glycosyltransferase involved in cell wall biosynthesis
LLSVVTGSYNRRSYLERTLDNVRNNAIRIPFELLVVDGGSTDGTLEWLIQQKDIVTIVQHNRGEFRGRPIERRSWGYFMNLAFKAAAGQYILMVSDDCLLLRDAVNRGIDRFQQLEQRKRRVGGVAFYFRNWPHEQEYYVQRTLGGKLMVNHGLFLRSAMEAVGWADEDRYIFYKADGDLCLRLWQAGFEIVDCPGAYVEHHGHANEVVRESNRAVLEHDRRAYQERWLGIFYHPGAPDARGRLSIRYVDPDHTAEQAWAVSSTAR